MELKGVWDGVIASDRKVVVEGKVIMGSSQPQKTDVSCRGRLLVVVKFLNYEVITNTRKKYTHYE
jgi:hypothetical protein